MCVYIYIYIYIYILSTGGELRSVEIKVIWKNPYKMSICATLKKPMKKGETKRFECPPRTIGNEVVIEQYLSGTALSLCEVEVYAKLGKTNIYTADPMI